MARSALFLLALLGRASGGPAAEGTCAGSEEECLATKGQSMLQTNQKATIAAVDGLEDDLLQGIYGDIAAGLAGVELLDGLDADEEGADDEGADLRQKPDRGSKEPEKALKAKAIKCICRGEPVRGDDVIEEWRGMTCDMAFGKPWVLKDCERFKTFLSLKCCGAKPGCGGELCPKGTDLLPEKKSHVHNGKQFHCRDADWWFQNGARKDHCRGMRHHFIPKCCKKEGYGYGSESDK